MKNFFTKLTILEYCLLAAVLSLCLALLLPGILPTAPSVRVNQAHAFASEALEEAIQRHKTTKQWPQAHQLNLSPPTGTAGFSSEGVAYEPGKDEAQGPRLSVTMSQDNDAAIAGKTIVLHAVLKAETSNAAPEYYFVCKTSVGTSIPAKFLPPQCRT